MRMIGVISDTHGLLRVEAFRALEGSDLILHAGDVGDGSILDDLQEIAPVRAIRGNTDYSGVVARLPLTEVVDLSGKDGKIRGEARGPLAYLIHDLEQLDVDPESAGISIVVTGHTHKPVAVQRGRVLYLNPGSAGPRRFSMPVSVAHVELIRGELRARIEHLSVED